MLKKFKLAVCQMNTQTEKNKNIEKARSLINEAAKNEADIVVLPEMFNCPYDNSMFPQYAETITEGETVRTLKLTAKENNVYLIGGSIPESDNGKIYNTSLVFDRNGNIIGRHRKVHLFDINVSERMVFRESDTLEAGNNITVVDTELCKIGIAICYDIRFPEQFRLMAMKGAGLIVVPGAFNMVTGPVHWEPLMKVRAMDNQVYIAAASPARNLDSSYISYANSIVVDPWGKIISAAGEKELIIYADIDLGYEEKVRAELPLLKHRRIDVYELKEK